MANLNTYQVLAQYVQAGDKIVSFGDEKVVRKVYVSGDTVCLLLEGAPSEIYAREEIVTLVQ